jgi:hypothetical protein
MFHRSPKALIESIRLMKAYLGDGKYHPTVTHYHLKKARRLMSVETHMHWGQRLRDRWVKQVREIGLDPETLRVVDEQRLAVACELFYDQSEKTFAFKEYRRRLAVARLNGSAEKKSAPEANEQRRAVLEGLGIELSGD